MQYKFDEKSIDFASYVDFPTEVNRMASDQIYWQQILHHAISQFQIRPCSLINCSRAIFREYIDGMKPHCYVDVT